jgi:hypothetical protein
MIKFTILNRPDGQMNYDVSHIHGNYYFFPPPLINVVLFNFFHEPITISKLVSPFFKGNGQVGIGTLYGLDRLWFECFIPSVALWR